MGTTPVVIPKPGEEENKDGGLAALQRQLREQTEEVGRMREALKVKNNPPTPPTSGPPDKKKIEEMFWQDPLPMVTAIANRAAYETEQRLQANTLPTQRATARDKIRSSDPEVFDLYSSEIETAINGVDPQFQGNINVWQNAFNIVKGQHTEEIVAARIEKAKGAPPVNNQTTSGDGPAAPSVRQPPPPKEKPLTAEEAEVAAGLGMTTDEYKRGKIRYDNQDNEWPKVITFSSATKRRADAAAKRKSA